MVRKSKRIFSMGFCGDWVELWELKPHPKDQGEFLFAFREFRKRKVLPLISGITAGGAEMIKKDLTTDRSAETLTRLCISIGIKLDDPCTTPIILS